MRYQDIRRHLKPYSVLSSRSTTIDHAFAAIIAPCEAYDPTRVREALRVLGQDPDTDLACVDNYSKVYEVMDSTTVDLLEYQKPV